MQLLSIAQSSLFSHAIKIGGTIGVTCFGGNGNSVGLGLGNSASGGSGELVGPFIGTKSKSSCTSGEPAIGTIVTGLSVIRALQCCVGLPVVPGGQKHVGLW